MKQVTKKKSTFERLDEELIEFYKYLKKKNFEEEEIRQIFEPLLKEKKRTIKKYVLVVLSVFFIFNMLVKTEFGWWYVLALSRMFLVQIKPFYDWSHLKNQECLVSKWWQKDLSYNFIPNCNFCENLRNVDILDRLNYDDLEEFYMEVQKPVILDYEGFPTVEYLWNSFFQNEDFLSSFPCALETNMMEKEGNVGKILRKISLFKDFFVHFQNCDYESMKYFRGIVPMPDSAPKHLSPVQYNWLIWAKSYNFPGYKKLELVDSENVKLIVQIDGEIGYRLSPPEGCRRSCGDIVVTLRKKQVLIFTNFWSLAYKNSGDENVAVIFEAHSIL